MDMTLESCRTFVEVLASNAPAPGGGGAAALVGAIGTALGNMVGSLTVGKKKYADVEEEIIALKAKCDALQKSSWTRWNTRSSVRASFPWPRPTAFPRTTPTGIRSWRKPPSPPAPCPLHIMELCCEAIDCVAVFAAKGSRLACPTRAALQCAARLPCRPLP